MRIQANNPVTLSQQFFAGGQHPCPLDSSDITAHSVTVAPDMGAAWEPAISLSTDNESLQAAIPADRATVRNWTVTFSGLCEDGLTRTDTQNVQGVGQHYIDIKAIRDHLFGNYDELDERYLLLARDRASSLIDRFCRRPFTPMWHSEILGRGRSRGGITGWGYSSSSRTQLTRSQAREVVVVQDADTGDEVTGATLSDNRLYVCPPEGGTLPERIRVGYLYGESYVPEDISYAALKTTLMIVLNLNSSLPANVRAITNELGLVQLNMANSDNPTGIPDVDAILRQHRQKAASWIY